MNKLKRTSFLLILASALTIAACSSTTGNQAQQSGSSTPAKSPIKIGVSVEKTGDAAEGGENIYQGVQIATDIVNEKGGIKGHPIELVIRDTEGNPTRGVSIIQEFGNKENVLAGIGGYFSTVMLAQTPIIKQAEFPFVVATSNVPDSVEKGLPWTFGVRMNAPTTAKYALDFIQRNFKTDKVAILHESGGYGKGAVTAMTSALEGIGKKPVAVESFDLKDQDMTAQVTRARDAGAEAIYLFGLGAANGYVIKAIEKIGWNVPVIGEMGMAQTAVPEIAGNAANGSFVIQTANYNQEQRNDLAKDFLNRAKQKFGKVPTMPAPSAQAFDGAMLLYKAIESIEYTGDMKKDRVALKNALESNAGPYKGVIRDWDKAFTTDNHDAIDKNSYLMNEWKDKTMIKSAKQ